MSWRPTVLALVVVIATAACSPGPARTIGTERLVDDLRDAVVEDYGLEALSVSCPDDVEAKAGKVFECEVELTGGVLHMEVEQEDDDGLLRFGAVEAVIPVEGPTSAIAHTYRTRIGRNVEVTCGDDLALVVAIDDTFACEAVDRQGITETVTGTVVSRDGAFELELEDGSVLDVDAVAEAILASRRFDAGITDEPDEPDEPGGDESEGDDLPGEELPSE